MDIKVDRRIYSDECISKAVYKLSDNYIVNRYLCDETEILTIEPKKEYVNADEVKNEVFSALNDYKLRQIIEKETHDIRAILYVKAFSEFDGIDCDNV